MLLFPFFENIEERRFLIVGGGRIARQKLSVLLSFTDRITVVAEEFDPETKALVNGDRHPNTKGVRHPSAEGVRHLEKSFAPEDISLGDYIIAATSDRELNAEISRLTKKAGKPVNVVDAPDLCTFFFPALIKRGGLVVGISTSGKSPAYAGYLRRELEEKVPDHIEEVLDTLEACRRWLPDILPEQKDRGAFLKELMTDLLASGKAEETDLRKRAEEFRAGRNKR